MFPTRCRREPRMHGPRYFRADPRISGAPPARERRFGAAAKQPFSRDCLLTDRPKRTTMWLICTHKHKWGPPCAPMLSAICILWQTCSHAARG